MMPSGPEQTVLDVHEFKRGMCEYLRRLAAGEIEIVIKRYRKPIAVVLSTRQTQLRNKAREAETALRIHANTLKRHAMQRRRILIDARLRWPLEKFMGFRCAPSGKC